MYTNKAKAVRHYDDLIVKVVLENSKITQDGWGEGLNATEGRRRVDSVLRAKWDVCG